MFPRGGFVSIDDGFAQGDHRRPEFPHTFVLRFHRLLVMRRRRGSMMIGSPMDGGGEADGERCDDKKNARICEWDIHRASSVRFV
jgi:hypothetical protein